MRGHVAARARALSAPRVATITLAGVFAIGCSEMPTVTMPSPSGEPRLSAAPGGSMRELARSHASRGIRSFRALPDSTLWRIIEASGSVATVGIRKPGAAHGFSNRGKWLVGPADWEAGQRAVSSQPGITLTKADKFIPVVSVQIRGLEALSRLRRLPHVEFVEPGRMVDLQFLSGPGCEDDRDYNGPRSYSALGDVVSGPFQWMGIDRAWQYSAGRGVMIGLSDTGIDSPELGANFATGWSTGRQVVATDQEAPPLSCSHGTRMGGVIAAPMNGLSMVGVAWGADLGSYKHGNDVFVYSEFSAIRAVRYAVFVDGASRMSDVVSMAWGTEWEYDSVKWEIWRWHYDHNVLFVAASGADPVPWSLFPSNLPEVLSVGAVNYDGSAPGSARDNTDIVAYHLVAATPRASSGAERITDLSQASAATAVVTGIAALVISLYPEATNQNVIDRLLATAGAACGMPPAWDPLLINAEAAVGGLCWNKVINGPTFISWSSGDTEPYKNVTYSVTFSGGKGPIEITWSNGAVGPTATYSWPRGTYTAGVSVTVRDAGIPFPGYSKTIQVENKEFPGGQCPYACN